MTEARIERSWTVRFKGIGPVVVNNSGRHSKDEAIREAIATAKRSYPQTKDFEILPPATYTEWHLGPIVLKKEDEKRKRRR